MPTLPPFATDEPDTFYESPPPPQRRIRMPPPPNPNARTSAYDMYVIHVSLPELANTPLGMTTISTKPSASLVSVPLVSVL